MNKIEFVKLLIDQNWKADVTGRDHSVPKPRIVSSGEAKRTQLQNQDELYVKDGGNTTKETAGLEWEAERQTEQVAIEVRTIGDRGGRRRLTGDVDDTTLESEDYGGLVGEVERIVDVHRRGEGDYQAVIITEKEDNSDMMGFNKYRADIQIELPTGPYDLNPPTS